MDDFVVIKKIDYAGNEVVERAVDIADRIYTAIENAGWMINVPPPIYVNKVAK